MFPRIYLFKNILLSNLTRANFPYKLTWALTRRCNARCKTCLIWKDKRDYELKYDEVINFFIENGYSKDAAGKAFDYYEALEWYDARGQPVLNWKSKMIANWFKPENKYDPGKEFI